MNYTQLERKAKYRYLIETLEKVETDKLYQGEVIEGDKNLEEQRIKDIEYLNYLISTELKKDGIKKMFIRGRTIRPI